MSEHQKFFELLKYSNELKKNKRFLRNEDSEAFNLLLNFSVTIENNLHYSEKQEYIELANNFLTNKIDADNFSCSFIAIYDGISRKLAQMKRAESLELIHFLKPSRLELGALLARIYGSCDSFSLNPEIAMSDEKELKNCAQLLLLELRKE